MSHKQRQKLRSLTLQSAELQEIARYFDKNLRRAGNLRTLHWRFFYRELMESRRMRVMTEIIKEGKTAVMAPEAVQFSDEFVAETWDRLNADKEKTVQYLAKGAKEREEAMMKSDADYTSWLRALEQSGLMSLWSAFEVVASDAWIHSVNARPDLFAIKVVKAFNEMLPEGMSAKSIPLGIAAKFDFDLRNHIGDIVGMRIDFTSLSEIKKAYVSAFGLVDEAQKMFESEDLKLLVLMRNLIAHRTGIIDKTFKERAKWPQEVGAELSVTAARIGEMVAVVEDVGAALLKVADDAIEGRAQPDQSTRASI